MTEREKRHTRKKWRQRKEHQKARKKRFEKDTPPSTPTSSPIEQTEENQEKVVVDKKVRKDRAACYRHLEQLKVKLRNKNREVERYRKRLQRTQLRLANKNSPRTKTKNVLWGQKVLTTTRRILFFHNVIIESLRKKYYELKKTRDKRVIDQLLTKSVLSKYRLKRLTAKELGVGV